jgi:hypothetical protein
MTTAKPRQIAAGFYAKTRKVSEINVDGNWHPIGNISMIPGGGARSAGARGGQYTFYDANGAVITRAAAGTEFTVR